jgi:hypothetical protein
MIAQIIMYVSVVNTNPPPPLPTFLAQVSVNAYRQYYSLQKNCTVFARAREKTLCTMQFGNRTFVL